MAQTACGECPGCWEVRLSPAPLYPGLDPSLDGLQGQALIAQLLDLWLKEAVTGEAHG